MTAPRGRPPRKSASPVADLWPRLCSGPYPFPSPPRSKRWHGHGLSIWGPCARHREMSSLLQRAAVPPRRPRGESPVGGVCKRRIGPRGCPTPKSRVPSPHHAARHLPLPASCWLSGNSLYLGPGLSASLRGSADETPREAWLAVEPWDPQGCRVTAKSRGRSVQCPLPALPLLRGGITSSCQVTSTPSLQSPPKPAEASWPLTDNSSPVGTE